VANDELSRSKRDLERTLEDLQRSKMNHEVRATQLQLIEAAKMESLAAWRRAWRTR